MLTKNYNYETIDKLKKILDGGLICDVSSDLHKTLLEEGHEFVGSYEFRKTGLLDCMVERKLYRDMDTNSLLIVDIGEDYEKTEGGSYEPYYYICIYVVDEELNQYEPELYYEYF